MKNVYYINLKHRTDRKIHIESQLNSLGWSYQRFNAIQKKVYRLFHESFKIATNGKRKKFTIYCYFRR